MAKMKIAVVVYHTYTTTGFSHLFANTSSAAANDFARRESLMPCSERVDILVEPYLPSQPVGRWVNGKYTSLTHPKMGTMES